MAPAPLSDRELDAYREQADRFIAELDEEFYLHYAGLKESFDLSPIYERHRDLTAPDVVKSIGLSMNGGNPGTVWDFYQIKGGTDGSPAGSFGARYAYQSAPNTQVYGKRQQGGADANRGSKQVEKLVHVIGNNVFLEQEFETVRNRL